MSKNQVHIYGLVKSGGVVIPFGKNAERIGMIPFFSGIGALQFELQRKPGIKDPCKGN